jgi:tRNA pseudouridine55 synthase
MRVTMAPFGLLNVNKPAGLTSRDAVNRVERLVRPAKAGHAGTLDPLATGVLVICVGQATRLIRFVQRMRKQYRATFLLGRRSETDDLEGEVIETPNAIVPSRAELDQVLTQFVGNIEQRPPAHSAIKIAGRRAYKLARRGKAVELAARTVTIHRLVVRRYEYPELELDIECGSGTYIRALGRDIAASLVTVAVMSALERTAIGPFCVEKALDPEKLSTDNLVEHFQSALVAVADLPRAKLTDAELIEIRHGRSIVMPRTETSGMEWAAVDSADQLVAILHEKPEGRLWPVHNFNS